MRIIPPEDEQLEYKRTVTKRGLCKVIVAMANTKGGQIVIGIDDDRTIVGESKLTAEDVAHMVRDGCVPPLAPKIKSEDIGGKKIITVTVEPNGDVPYMTVQGVYHVRVGATVRIASISELIGLIVKGPHGNMIRFKARVLQLRDQIYGSMSAEAGFDQALTGIAELSDLATKVDESMKMEVVDIVGELLVVPCNNDEVIWRMLVLLAALTSDDMAYNRDATPPSKVLFARVIEIMERVLEDATFNPKVTNKTRHILNALYIVGLGCIWSNYDDQLEKVMEAIDSKCNRDRKLTKLCRDVTTRLEKCAAEEPTYPPRRLGMRVEPFVDQLSNPVAVSLFRHLF